MAWIFIENVIPRYASRVLRYVERSDEGFCVCVDVTATDAMDERQDII